MSVGEFKELLDQCKNAVADTAPTPHVRGSRAIATARATLVTRGRLTKSRGRTRPSVLCDPLVVDARPHACRGVLPAGRLCHAHQIERGLVAMDEAVGVELRNLNELIREEIYRMRESEL